MRPISIFVISVTALIPVMAAPVFGKEPSESNYSIKFVLKMSDGKYFGGVGTCKKNSDCGVEFEGKFQINIIEYKESYRLSIYNFGSDMSLLRCCSVENRTESIMLDHKKNRNTIKLYYLVGRDLVYVVPKKYGDLFLIVSDNH
ncbi:hypothetical protein [Mesorhizobium sp. STM 4661]|uniref:hypothetical protein n=1 Tax=Mesorhizobium sp. STM 4661 TaxID=1297570 RepID=UPI0012F77D07|nr:hypothetical protein [Mesorhizobium sp. STM 4661]